MARTHMRVPRMRTQTTRGPRSLPTFQFLSSPTSSRANTSSCTGSSLVFVRPRWIYSCNEKQKLLPHQLYGVVPQA
ncbi:X-ray repair cross complementing 1 [Rhinolophus ferrumequinum]|uniref:X-ray repair cross complementing 1 n=1 Tax=Rhinolophus ferrumequinum TaxID=59479 RepID=A0A7J7SMS0_RHIFE|nr:X-ray repair cross complementing 1 [Rhinolophus ferrumequinum]